MESHKEVTFKSASISYQTGPCDIKLFVQSTAKVEDLQKSVGSDAVWLGNDILDGNLVV